MLSFRSFAATGAFASLLLLSPLTLTAQQPTNIAPGSAANQTATNTSFSKEQLLTSTVHQAWQLSGKNEANFFNMVEQLAEISAQNRGVTLPDSEAAGRRMGDYIKRLAKSDTDQLLYAVVDKAVVMVTKAPVHPAGSAASAKPKS